MTADPAAALARWLAVLAERPDDGAARREAGRCCRQLGRLAEAADHFARAAALAPRDPDSAIELVQCQLALRDLAGAEAEARRLARALPRSPAALNLLGVVLKTVGKPAEAVAVLRRALTVDRKGFALWINLGNAQLARGDPRDALASFRAAARLQPRSGLALRHVGLALLQAEDFAAALVELDRALELDPGQSDARADRAVALFRLDRGDEALAAMARAIADAPGNAEFVQRRARMLKVMGRIPEAVAALEAWLAARPPAAPVLAELGELKALHQDDPAGANPLLRRAWALAPEDRRTAATLLWSLQNTRGPDERDRITEAADLGRALLDAGGELQPVAFGLQSVFLKTADFDALARLPPMAGLMRHWAEGNQVAALHNQLGRVETDRDRRDLIAMHRLWGERVEAAAVPERLRRPGRGGGAKVRIGLMSSDLRNHPIAYFALPLFELYDRNRFELFAYSFYPGAPDPVQQTLAGLADRFRVIASASDQQVAQAIADDGLDILFDLGGSTHLNRLTVLAWKPAPLQCSWLAYPHSSGLGRIDFNLVDPYLKPPEPALLIERPFELPHSWVAVGGRLGFVPEPVEPGLPADRTGVVTFGTMNNPLKYTRAGIALWARAMQAVAGSRFLFVRPEGGVPRFVDNIRREFARHGIGGERIDFIEARGGHLPWYNRIDVALDTLPQTGGTTTCEAAWMGVPTVTLVGPAFFERLSYSNLSNCGLGELCARSPDAYVSLAVALAEDTARRRPLRAGLRDQIRAQPLGQVERWVADFQDAVLRVLPGRP